MKRIILYAGILAAMAAVPKEPSDVGNLLPVQVVSIYKENGWTVIETDTEDKGMGSTAAQALQNLKDTAAGDIYLDTAQYLLLTEETVSAPEELRHQLRPSVGLCLSTKKIDLSKVGDFLTVHGNLPKLKNWNEGRELPVLGTFGDALIFLKKVENSS